MARCDEGYRCEVCGGDVEDITESDLYLRFVIGEVDPEFLHMTPERHIRCNPTLAQFIVAEGFEPVVVEGPFAKSELDPDFVAEEEQRVTAGYWTSQGTVRPHRGDPDHRVSPAGRDGSLAGTGGERERRRVRKIQPALKFG